MQRSNSSSISWKVEIDLFKRLEVVEVSLDFSKSQLIRQ